MRVMPCLNRRDLICFAACCVAALVASPAIADRNGEHNRARRAVERGEALPLVDVLAKVGPDLGGEIVGVSFERKQDLWVYEFKVVEPGGRLVEVYVDAASGRVLKREAD
jgi:uncharacterized membrane protein YkoI